MGVHGSKPVTTKDTAEEQDHRLSYGASSMQGWRLSQEDAHNCILEYDTNGSLFAVYDGHGGHEVAQYCSERFPDLLKSLDSYKNGEYSKALEEAFLDIDASILTEENTAYLKKLEKEKADDGDCDEDDEENVNNQSEKASMPMEMLMEKCTGRLRSKLRSLEGKDLSPNEADSLENNLVSNDNEDIKLQENGFKLNNGNSEQNNLKNGAAITSEEESSPTALTKNGDSKKDKGLVENADAECPINNGRIRLRQSIQDMYAKLLADCNSDDSEDEEDESFEDTNAESSDEDEDEDEDEEDDDDDEEDSSKDVSDDSIDENLRKGPGRCSGCAAIVALLKDNTLYVANAGDSRCVVSRNGKAFDLSVDHKPINPVEMERVQKAGGKVNKVQNRICGLSLSRAIGDHECKRNKNLTASEQQITAFPDVQKITVDPTDVEFMVLACDGIWDVKSSQEIVDFVRPKLQEGKSPSIICESLLDECLSPDTTGNGIDNMTVIIVQFKPKLLKRSSSREPEEPNKHAKVGIIKKVKI